MNSTTVRKIFTGDYFTLPNNLMILIFQSILEIGITWAILANLLNLWPEYAGMAIFFSGAIIILVTMILAVKLINNDYLSRCLQGLYLDITHFEDRLNQMDKKPRKANRNE